MPKKANEIVPVNASLVPGRRREGGSLRPVPAHVGSATTSFMNRIERELEGSGRYRHWDVTVESVFIAEDESDCEVRATR